MSSAVSSATVEGPSDARNAAAVDERLAGAGVLGLPEDVEVLSDSDDEEADTTAAQHLAGKDIQENRIKQYMNYVNLREEYERNHNRVFQSCTPVVEDGDYYSFFRNSRTVHSTIVHFQLRNLLWATSKHEVYVVNENCVVHWNELSRQTTKVLDLSGRGETKRGLRLGSIMVSTMCVAGGLVCCGGFNGELVVSDLRRPDHAASLQVTTNENAITNGIEVCEGASGALRVMTSNNDEVVRVFDAATLACAEQFRFPWAVNWATKCPGGALVAVVGDDPVAVLVDERCRGAATHLHGHLDYSFAAAWHPSGHLLATGNQDTTTRVWDVRAPHEAVAVLRGRMGAIRALRFSPDGALLTAAEPVDFVTTFDTASGFTRCQTIDIFGEVAGISFSPDGEALYISIADTTYSSLLRYERRRCY